jgi:hypothetical protein
MLTGNAAQLFLLRVETSSTEISSTPVSAMTVIAVAGGTGNGVERSIVKACSFNHEVIVLSRKLSRILPRLVKEGNTVLEVDSASHSSLIKALKGVNVLMNTVFSYDQSWAQSQIGLLHAAIEYRRRWCICK